MAILAFSFCGWMIVQSTRGAAFPKSAGRIPKSLSQGGALTSDQEGLDFCLRRLVRSTW